MEVNNEEKETVRVLDHDKDNEKKKNLRLWNI